MYLLSMIYTMRLMLMMISNVFFIMENKEMMDLESIKVLSNGNKNKRYHQKYNDRKGNCVQCTITDKNVFCKPTIYYYGEGETWQYCHKCETRTRLDRAIDSIGFGIINWKGKG